jgi:hypothetical protein
VCFMIATRMGKCRSIRNANLLKQIFKNSPLIDKQVIVGVSEG